MATQDLEARFYSASTTDYYGRVFVSGSSGDWYWEEKRGPQIGPFSSIQSAVIDFISHLDARIP
jgi:hypothetical protein